MPSGERQRKRKWKKSINRFVRNATLRCRMSIVTEANTHAHKIWVERKRWKKSQADASSNPTINLCFVQARVGKCMCLVSPWHCTQFRLYYTNASEAKRIHEQKRNSETRFSIIPTLSFSSICSESFFLLLFSVIQNTVVNWEEYFVSEVVCGTTGPCGYVWMGARVRDKMYEQIEIETRRLKLYGFVRYALDSVARYDWQRIESP